MSDTTAKLLLNIDLLSVKKLTELVKEKYDYDFTNYALASFKRRVAKVLYEQKIAGIEELITKLKTTPSFFPIFLSHITVNVTEMFRDSSFWLYLRDELLPDFKGKPFKIWHAGCSSGEEVYSMCILLKELGMLHLVEITASDMDTTILKQAKKGKYSIKYLPVNNQNYKNAGGVKTSLATYMTESSNHFYINDEMKEHVVFKEHNLVKGEGVGHFDLILCRNVLIYFNQELQNEVLNTLHKNLKDDGLLAIGTKESLVCCANFKKFDTLSIEEKTFIKIND